MFIVTVKIEDIEKRRRSAGLLHIVIGLFIIAKGADHFKYLEYTNIFTVIPIFAIGIISVLYGFFRRKLDITAKYNYALRLAQVICFFILFLVFLNLGRSIDYLGVLLFAGLSVLLLFSEKKIFQETTIYIDKDGIRIPGHYREHLVQWKELTEVVVREDFITMFHVKKKYLQYQVMQDLSTLELAKINGFCKEMIGELVN
jgi:hypothetical protein